MQAELYRCDDAAIVLDTLAKLPAAHHTSVVAAVLECCGAKSATARMEGQAGVLDAVILSVKAAAPDVDAGKRTLCGPVARSLLVYNSPVCSTRLLGICKPCH